MSDIDNDAVRRFVAAVLEAIVECDGEIWENDIHERAVDAGLMEWREVTEDDDYVEGCEPGDMACMLTNQGEAIMKGAGIR